MFYRLIMLLCLLILTGCGMNVEKNSVQTRDLSYGITYDPGSFDPHFGRSADVGIVLRQIYDTLVYRDPITQQFVPGLALEWLVSNDGLIYTFRLRDGVTFHDGSAFNSASVAANLDRITNPDNPIGKSMELLGPYEGYEIVDDYAIRIKLSEPYAPLLDGLSQFYLGIASPDALNTYSLSRYQFHQVGTGPYKLVDFIPGKYVILEFNDAYSWHPVFYDREILNPVQRIEYRFITNNDEKVNSLANGSVQVIGDLLPSDARALSVSGDVQILPVALPGQPLQLLINTERFPTDNISIRQALLFGTNKDEIVDEIFQGFSPVAWGPISSSTLYFSQEMIGLYAYDIESAQQALEIAGYSDTDNDGYVDIDGINLAVTILIPPWDLIPEVAIMLQEQWRIIGVQVILETYPTLNSLREAVGGGQYNLVAYNSFGIDPVLLNDFYSTDGDYNWSRYSDPGLDQLLLEGMQKSDPVVRAGAYVLAQRAIMNEALVLPIREYVRINGVSSQLSGLRFDPYGWYPLLNDVDYFTLQN